MTEPKTLTAIVQAFFERHLVSERNVSPNTVISYRDCLVLFLRFAAQTLGKSPDALRIEDLDGARVRDFLDSLRAARGVSPRTRNQRLAALKSFFRYLGGMAPEHLDRSRQVREIPSQRAPMRSVGYLEEAEMAALCRGAQAGHRTGIRDLALLTLLHNTGARVQEVVDLRVSDVRLEGMAMVHLRGKGRKERDVPLRAETVRCLRDWLTERGLDGACDAPLFVNARGERLTRWGLTYIVKTATKRAVPACPALAGRHVTPHVIRHTTAMHLLRSGVDLNVIAAWLGHASLATTHGYVEIDLRMKEAAVTKATSFLPRRRAARYPKPSLVAWLDNLGRRPNYVKSG